MPTILVVDDQPDNLAVLSAVLNQYLPDASIHCAGSVDKGFDLVAGCPPDVILLDVQMPGVSGIEMCRRLKADPATEHIPVILITAQRTDARERAAGLDAGADDFLNKPIENVELVARIHVALRIKQAEDQLRQHGDQQLRRADISEAQSRTILQTAMDGFWLADLQGQLLEVNEAYCWMSGYTRDELLTLNIAQVEAEETAEEVVAHLARLKEEGTARFASRHRRKDGRIYDVEVSAKYVRLESGERLVVFLRDISERSKVEEALREKEHLLSESQRIAHIGSWFYAMKDPIVWSDEMYRIYGVSRETFTPTVESLIGLIHPGDRSAMQAWLTACASGEAPGDLEFRINRPDGTVRHISGCGELVCDKEGRPTHMAGTAQDITGRKHAEESLRKSEERFRDLADLLPQTVFECDAGGRLTFANKKAIAAFGYSAEEIEQGLMIQDTLVPEDRERARANLQGVLSGLPTGNEYTALRKDGTRFPIVIYSAPILSEGLPVGLRGIIVDMSEQRRAEEALRNVVVGARCVLWDADVKEGGHWRMRVHASDLTSRELGLHEFKGETAGQEWASHIPPEQQEQMNRTCADALRMGAPGYEQEFIFRDAKGKERWLREDVKITKTGPGLFHLIGVCVDITDRKRAEEAVRESEERLRQAEKMTAVGQLAGGVAHDFNNQLTGIMGYADMLAERIQDERLRTYVQGILVSATRASDLTQQLLAFSRKGKYLSVPVDVHVLIGEVVAILERTIDKRIHIRQLLRADQHVALGDPTQLQNALLNIALNARDAMTKGGELTFETDVTTLDESYCRNSPYEIVPGSYLRVSISDTGRGMTDEVKKHLFEPFFTTKGPGKGTGMGLAGAYGTVRNHHGTISVYSEVDRGTTVRICLPLVVEVAEVGKPVPVAAPDQGTAHILLVDDEDVIREMGAEMLRSLGYTVTTCADGRKAAAYFQEHWKEVDLVILDMVMPEMGGHDTFMAMRRINPAVRALLSSGYSLNGEAQGILNEGVLGFVGKPYRRVDLSRSVVEALGRG